LVIRRLLFMCAPYNHTEPNPTPLATCMNIHALACIILIANDYTVRIAKDTIDIKNVDFMYKKR